MRWTAVLVLAGFAAGVPLAAAGREGADPPRIRRFSPAAIHAGDDFLVDADFDGRRPRVLLGGRRLPSSGVHVEDGPDGARRVWAHIPKRFPAGSHSIEIETRSGKAAAAKPIEVASCDTPFEPVSCNGDGLFPPNGFVIVITGAKGFTKTFSGSNSLVANMAYGRTSATTRTDPFGYGPYFSVTIDAPPSQLHVGDVPGFTQDYFEQLGRYFRTPEDPRPAIRVAAETPTSVTLCIDAQLSGKVDSTETGIPGVTLSFRARGYMVLLRGAPPAADCGDVADSGFALTIDGDGYHKEIASPNPVITGGFEGSRGIALQPIDGAGPLVVGFSQEPSTMKVGDLVDVVGFSFSIQAVEGGPAARHFAAPTPPSPLRVVEAAADHVTFCVDVVMPRMYGEDAPAEIHMTGYIGVQR